MTKNKFLHSFIVENINFTHGGIERYLYQVIESFFKQSKNVECFMLTPFTEHEDLANTPIRHVLPCSGKNIFSKICNIIYTIIKLKKNSKDGIIHCGHLHLLKISYVVSFFTKKPIALYLYGIEFWGNSLEKYSFYLNKVKYLVTISEFSKKQIESQNINLANKKIIMISPSYKGEIISTPRKFRSNNKFNLLTVGRISSQEQYKGHDQVIMALSELRKSGISSINYDIVGTGDDIPRLEELVKKENLIDQVKFWGKVSEEELAKRYQCADVFIMPSLTIITTNKIAGEGFGIVFLEAAAHGLPLIGPNKGGSVDIIQDGKNGLLVDALSFKDIAAKIKILYDDTQLCNQMSVSSVETLKNVFSSNAFDLKVLDIV